MKTELSEQARADLRRTLGEMESFAPLAPELETRRAALAPRGRRSNPRPLLVALGAAAAVFALALPVALLSRTPDDGVVGVSAPPPTQTGPASPEHGPTTPENADTSEIPEEIVAYWALEGTLESVGDESGWLCPTKPSVGYSSEASASAIPDDLTFDLVGATPTDSYLRDDGPTCSQPPSLVLLAFVDETRDEAIAGMSVWPSTTRFEDTCPPETCSIDLEDGQALEPLTINDQPARLFAWEDSYKLWWVGPNGVPAYTEASGLSRDDLLAAAESISFNPIEHTASIDDEIPAGMDVVEQGASQGVWEQGLSRTDVYDIDGASVAVRAQYDSSQTPYSRYASGVSFLELADVHGAPAAWIPEGGNFLIFEPSDEVIVYIEGTSTLEGAVQVAEDLR